MTTRRDFLKQGGLAAAGIATASGIPRAHDGARRPSRGTEPLADDRVRELMMTALAAARDAGASYADVRIGRYRTSVVSTR